MPDAEPQALPDPAPGAAAPPVQRIRLAVVGLSLLGLPVQFYLAGRGAFVASSYSTHKDFGDILHLVTPVILILTLVNRVTRNRVDVIHSVALVVLFEVQFALATFKHP